MHRPASAYAVRRSLLFVAGLCACSIQVPKESELFRADANGGADSSQGGNDASGGESSDAGGRSSSKGGNSSAQGGSSASSGSGTQPQGGNGGTTQGGSSVSIGGSSASIGGSSTAPQGGSTSIGGTVSTGGVSHTGGSSAMGGTTTAPIILPPSSAMLKYDFDVSMDTVATDSTTNAHNGTLANVTLAATGRNTDGATFAAADSAIVLPQGLFAQTKMLNVSVWVKLTGNGVDNRLFTLGDGTTSYLYLTLNDGAATPGIRLKFLAPGGTEKTVFTPTQLPLNVWKHVTVTVTAAGAAIHVDSKVVAKDPSLVIDPSVLGETAGGVVGNSPAGTNAFEGMIDEFHLYEGGLTRSEILALSAPKTDYSIFHFDEGTGTATEDSSDRNKDGTLIGGATWAPGIMGTAVKLDNGPTGPAVQYVDLADGLIQDCGYNLTLAGWINLETNNLLAPMIEVAPGTTGNLHLGTAYKKTSELDLTFQMGYNSTSWVTCRAPQVWQMGRWYHIAAVRSGATGTTVQVFINGVSITPSLNDWTNAKTAYTEWGATTQNYFGKTRDDYSYAGLDAAIDEILIACRAYTADEIAQLAYHP